MADHNKGGFISKAQKRLTRTKTKVLQNLGKVEKTADEKFDEHVHKLDRQQEVAHRFQKELRNYIHCAKAMEMASKSFYTVMLETFEQDWRGMATLRETLQALELMWSDYLQRLQDSVLEPITTYTSHFHPLKLRIAKRNRKLDYYDNARHNAEVQQNAKKKDEAKIQKAADEREDSRKVYEELNNELHHELPEFNNSRVNFYATTFKNFFNAENTFHGETGKLNDTAMSLSEELAEEHKQYTYQPRPLSGVITNDYRFSLFSIEAAVNGHSSGDNDSNYSGNRSSIKQEKISPKPDRPPSSPAVAVAKNPQAKLPDISRTSGKTNGDRLSNGLSSDADSPPDSPVYENSDLGYTTPPTTGVSPEVEVKKTEVEGPVDDYEEPMVSSELHVVNGSPLEDEIMKKVEETVKQKLSDSTENILPSEPPLSPPELPKDPPPEDEELPPKEAPSKQTEEGDESDHYYDRVPDPVEQNVNQKDDDDDDNFYEIPSSSKIPDKLPDGCLFVVVATHLYKNEDEDELSFEAGELIYVVPYDDPDDQDDGWLIGIKKSDGKKGVFPENFTKRV